MAKARWAAACRQGSQLPQPAQVPVSVVPRVLACTRPFGTSPYVINGLYVQEWGPCALGSYEHLSTLLDQKGVGGKGGGGGGGMEGFLRLGIN